MVVPQPKGSFVFSALFPGRWIDFKNDYKTLDTSFMESVWWVFKEIHKKGLVYKGYKVRNRL